MSFERQPARLAIINLRQELDRMINEPAQEKPRGSGLLSPNKMMTEKTSKSDEESQRVLNYMKQIRESMTNGV
tara:strand:- start:656 stop:874 length:219 start_codon:yes stop_codon:yes gene_type:complete